MNMSSMRCRGRKEEGWELGQAVRGKVEHGAQSAGGWHGHCTHIPMLPLAGCHTWLPCHRQQPSWRQRQLSSRWACLGDGEASADVDGRGNHGRARQGLRGVARHQAAPRQHHAPHRGQPRDGIGDGHEGGVQGWGDAPHGLVATDGGQPKLCDHGGEGGGGGDGAQAHDARQANCCARRGEAGGERRKRGQGGAGGGQGVGEVRVGEFQCGLCSQQPAAAPIPAPLPQQASQARLCSPRSPPLPRPSPHSLVVSALRMVSA